MNNAVKWGASTAVWMGGVAALTYAIVFVLVLPLLLPFVGIGVIWALWPRPSESSNSISSRPVYGNKRPPVRR